MVFGARLSCIPHTFYSVSALPQSPPFWSWLSRMQYAPERSLSLFSLPSPTFCPFPFSSVSSYFPWAGLEAALIWLPVFSNRFLTLAPSWNLQGSFPKYWCLWPLSRCFVVPLGIQGWFCAAEHHALETCSLPWSRKYLSSYCDLGIGPARPDISSRPLMPCSNWHPDVMCENKHRTSF